MSLQDDVKDMEYKLEKSRSYNTKIGKDASTLLEDGKENVLGLARNIRDASAETAHDAVGYVRNRMDDLRVSGTDALEKVETRIKEKPGQSVAIAFTAGVLASYLLGRRSSRNV